MDMTGERRIPAPREKVWEGLNDPAILKACIPGCESLEKEGDTGYAAVASIKIGPISARFNGRVQLLDLDPPNSYRIQGEGAGGVAGFAKGGAKVGLTEEGFDTLLRYEVQAQVGGKIAQLGARLIDATAKSMAETFFTRFAAAVATVPPTVMADSESGLIAEAGELIERRRNRDIAGGGRLRRRPRAGDHGVPGAGHGPPAAAGGRARHRQDRDRQGAVGRPGPSAGPAAML
jgi:carbon monoxide dehydrogenase subunit G